MALSNVASSVRQVLSGVDDGQSHIVNRIREPAGAPGWFVPGDAIWTVHGSVATFLGGIRSILLQSLHPLALAGVNRHSTFREDPFGRLQRTGAFIAATTFGSTALAEQTVTGIRHLHDRVCGTLDDGRTYSANDPRLLQWVHVTLVDSMLTAYERFGRDGFVPADAYVRDMAVVGRAMGVVEPPQTRAELTELLDSYLPELSGGSPAVAVKQFVLAAPLPPRLRMGYRMLSRTALDTLPEWARDMLEHHPSAALVRARGLGTGLVLRLLKAALVKSPAQAAGEARLSGPPAVASASEPQRSRGPLLERQR